MIKLREKTLDVLKQFVIAFPLTDWYQYTGLAEHQNLVENIVSIRRKILCENDARRLIQEVVFDVLIKHKVDEGRNLSEEDATKFKEDLFERLKAYVESLPRKYYVRMEIPNFSNWGEFRIDISNRIKLVCDDFSLGNKTQDWDHKHLTFAEFLNPTKELNTYLLIETRGFCSSTPNAPTTAEAISLGKQCIFLLMSYGLVERNYHKHGRANLETVYPPRKESIRLPESVSSSLGLSPKEDKLLIYGNPGFSILGDPGRAAETNEEKIAAFSNNLHQIRNYFTKEKHPDFPSLSAAIEWYQDSLFSDNQTFAYLAACIGLEALLGTDDFMDLMSKRLSDRFATLMGKGRTERNKLAKDYTEVLRLRGEIVHAKEARLTAKHQQSLSKVQRMLLDVIWHELQNLLRSENLHENHLISKKKLRKKGLS